MWWAARNFRVRTVSDILDCRRLVEKPSYITCILDFCYSFVWSVPWIVYMLKHYILIGKHNSDSDDEHYYSPDKHVKKCVHFLRINVTASFTTFCIMKNTQVKGNSDTNILARKKQKRTAEINRKAHILKRFLTIDVIFPELTRRHHYISKVYCWISNFNCGFFTLTSIAHYPRKAAQVTVCNNINKSPCRCDLSNFRPLHWAKYYTTLDYKWCLSYAR